MLTNVVDYSFQSLHNGGIAHELKQTHVDAFTLYEVPTVDVLMLLVILPNDIKDRD